MADKKFRMTDQRRIILDELEKTYEHPSASDIYEKVKKRLPHISLGTVYRNLEILSSRGIIKRLDIISGQRRYDAGVSQDHYHIRCTACGRVDDIPFKVNTGISSIISRASEVSGYTQTDCTVDFFGICPNCAQKT